MAKSDRHKRLIAVKKRVAGIVTEDDRKHPDWDGKCSVPTRLAKKLVHAEKQAALLACEVHDLRAMKIRGWCRQGQKWILLNRFPDGSGNSRGIDYKEYTKPWRADVKAANKEFKKNIRIGLGWIYGQIYFWGVGNKFARKNFTPEKGPMAQKAREAERIAAGLEGDG